MSSRPLEIGCAAGIEHKVSRPPGSWTCNTFYSLFLRIRRQGWARMLSSESFARSSRYPRFRCAEVVLPMLGRVGKTVGDHCAMSGSSPTGTRRPEPRSAFRHKWTCWSSRKRDHGRESQSASIGVVEPPSFQRVLCVTAAASCRAVKREAAMTRGTFRLPAIVLGAAGFVLLLPLVSPSLAIAKTDVHRQRSAVAIHPSPGAAAHVVHRAGASGHRFVSSGAHTVVSSRRYSHNFGRHYHSGGYAVTGTTIDGGYIYPSYASGYYSRDYGYASPYHHSCGWYHYHEPYNLPYRCRAHGYSYSYIAPSNGYRYAYGSSSGYGYQAGAGHYRHYAVHGGSRRMMAAGVHTHGGAHMVSLGGPRMIAHGGPHPVAHGGHAHGHVP